MRAVLFVVVLLAIIGGGCWNDVRVEQPKPPEVRQKITVAGSTALLPLVEVAAAEFRKKQPKVTISIAGGGSFTGLQQVAAGTVDIAISDVEAAPYNAPDDFRYQGPKGRAVAVCPFLLIVHPAVGVSNVTEEQAVGIFTGRIRSWREIGGKDLPIVIINRAKSSGSRQIIKDLLLQGQEFTGRARMVNSNVEVRRAVAGTPGAIGYASAACLDDSVRALRLNGIDYSMEAVNHNTYKLYALEYVYTRGNAKGIIKEFVDFIVSESFQAEVEELGFLPVVSQRK